MLDAQKCADKGTVKLERRHSEADNGRELRWQAQGKNATEKSSAYAMMQMHRKDASNAFKAALQAFGVTWERKSKPAEKVPA